MTPQDKKSHEMTPAERKRESHLFAKYGITLAQYNQQLKDQDFKCAMCAKPANQCKRALHVDHNHGKSKRIRGLVCFYCNRELIRKHSLRTARLLLAYMLKYEPEVNSNESAVSKSETNSTR